MGSLTTCDPGDINKTIQEAHELKIKCSVINLAAEVRIYRELVTRKKNATQRDNFDIIIRKFLLTLYTITD